MVFFLVLSIFLLERKHIGFSGIAFGIAASVKIVPVLFLPAMLLALPDLRTSLKWLSLAAAAWICAGLPYIVEEPTLILSTIFGYSGAAGLWGLYLFAELGKLAGFARPLEVYAPVSKWIAVGSALLLPVVIRLTGRRPPLFAVCGLVAFVFVLLTPGFAVQYLAWTVPWIVVLGFGDALVYSVAAGAFLVAVYAAAIVPGHGVHLYADFLTFENQGMKILFGSILWTVIGVVVWRQGRKIQASLEDGFPIMEPRDSILAEQ
jgi:hypothetical protein